MKLRFFSVENLPSVLVSCCSLSVAFTCCNELWGFVIASLVNVYSQLSLDLYVIIIRATEHLFFTPPLSVCTLHCRVQ